MAKDAYKYFRVEARELLEGLTQGILELEKGSAAPEVLSRLLRLAHTLKGAARVVRQPAIAEVAHRMEDHLVGHRDSGAPVPGETVAVLLEAIDAIAGHVRALDIAPERPAAPARPQEEPFETVRVEIQELDTLLRDATEAGVQLGALRRDLAAVDHLRDLAHALQDQLESRPEEGGVLPAAAVQRARSIGEELGTSLDRFERAIAGHLERVEGDLSEARGTASRLRLVPARTVFGTLERAVHDAARELGRSVVLETDGGEVRIDAGVLAALRDALLHIVRNAVAHGIESEAVRIAAGKPAAGRVRLEVERIGNRVAFRCRDDGRGIDVEAVRSAAVARGVLPADRAAALGREAVLRMIFTAGLSTHREVTEISGRGVGLDVAREAVARLKGEVAVSSESGRGTAIELRVPVSLASFTGLLVSGGDTIASIPLDAVRGALLLKATEISRANGSDAVAYEGSVVPFLALESALHRRPRTRARVSWPAVIVEANGGLAAVGVDRIVGTSVVVMRSLPAFVSADRLVAGVSLDSEGNPQLVLDPAGIVETARAGGRPESEEAAPPRLPLLVIDDSLTTRMLEKSILESAGYTVELATSAEEALEKAREHRYGLFIVDVEMPGMDGFTFVAQTRADPVLRETPAILVTSRNEPEDLRRGEQSGARAHIVKSEFDQGRLLQIIRTLVGQAR